MEDYMLIPDSIYFAMRKVTGEEFKILLYLLKHTNNFRKRSELSIQAICHGVPGVDGGAGVSKAEVALCLKSLVKKGYVENNQSFDEHGLLIASTYDIKDEYLKG